MLHACWARCPRLRHRDGGGSLDGRRFAGYAPDRTWESCPRAVLAWHLKLARRACSPRSRSSSSTRIPIRAAILEDGLREAGHVHVVRVDEMSHLLARIYAIDPDVILIDLENPSRDVLEQMFQVSRAVKRPVAMFVDQSDTASIEAAVDAGVSAYIVGGMQKERSRTSSISASRASMPLRGCATNSSTRAPRSRSAR
jgi:CheY-like chemotaxis protein